MPRVASTNVAHSSVSDHRVPRQAGAFPTEAVPPPSLNVPLRNFHGYLVEANDADIGRDLGIALIESHSVDLRQPALNLHARRLLEAAIGTWPEDVPVWIALGRVHAAQHRYEDALDAYEHALVCAPENEVALVAAASVRTARGDQEAAVQTWQRAIAINPWRSSYHAARAKLLSKSLEWQQAADESQAALRLNPVDVETRRVLLLSLSRLGRREEARQELKRLLRLQPTVPEGAGRLGADQGDIRD